MMMSIMLVLSTPSELPKQIPTDSTVMAIKRESKGSGNRKKQWQSRAYRVIAVQGLPCTSEPDLYHQIFSVLDTTYLVSSQGGDSNKFSDIGSDFFFSGSRSGLTNWGGNKVLYMVILYNHLHNLVFLFHLFLCQSMPVFGLNIPSLASWAYPAPHSSLQANTF